MDDLLKNVNEMTMRVGDLAMLSKQSADRIVSSIETETFLADIEGKFKSYTAPIGESQALIIRSVNGTFAHLTRFTKVGERRVYINEQYTTQEFAGNKLSIKALLLLKFKLHFSEMELGEIHSKATQGNIKNIITAFNAYWFNRKTNERVSLTLNNYAEKPYSAAGKLTGWVVLLENDGDFSSVPTIFGPGLENFMYSIMCDDDNFELLNNGTK